MADSDMAWARLDPGYVPPEIDTTKPSVARVYDAILGGKDNFAVDRAIAEQTVNAMGDGGSGARLNRAALGRAVRFMTRQGVSQFLDLGSGLPTVQNTHQIAQGVNPAARVVYADNDPSVYLHGRALLAGDASTAVVLADVREPDKLLRLPEVIRMIDFTKPVGLILNAVIHHLLDDEDPYGVLARYKEAAAPGSYLQITHFCDAAPEARESVRVLRENLGRGQIRSREEIKRFFDGWELVPPGLVFLSEWRPDEPATLPIDVGSFLMLAGVARKPLPCRSPGSAVAGRRHPERGGEVPGQVGLVGVAEVGGERGPVHVAVRAARVGAQRRLVQPGAAHHPLGRDADVLGEEPLQPAFRHAEGVRKRRDLAEFRIGGDPLDDAGHAGGHRIRPRSGAAQQGRRGRDHRLVAGGGEHRGTGPVRRGPEDVPGWNH